MSRLYLISINAPNNCTTKNSDCVTTIILSSIPQDCNIICAKKWCWSKSYYKYSKIL